MGFDIALGDDFPDHVTAALFNEEALGIHEQLIRGLIWPLTTVEPPKDWLEWFAESDNEQRLDGDVEIGPETSAPRQTRRIRTSDRTARGRRATHLETTMKGMRGPLLSCNLVYHPANTAQDCLPLSQLHQDGESWLGGDGR
jgi:hypothetical protein